MTKYILVKFTNEWDTESHHMFMLCKLEGETYVPIANNLAWDNAEHLLAVLNNDAEKA